jgi:CHAD domain-containing protein
MRTKWAEIVDPHQPARQFARAVLGERLAVVKTILPQAAHQQSDDIEHVHQLRVGCRRAVAALRAFAPLMKKQPKPLKKLLGEIRAAAGPARDIDVLLARFEKEKADAVGEYAIERLEQERAAAQASLNAVTQRATSDKLSNVIRTTLKLLNAKGSKKPRLGDFGREAVRLAYVPFAQLALLENPTTMELHELRIAGKRLRYSLEIFPGLEPALIGQVYPIVEELQTRLGEINDHATAQALYQSWLAEIPANALAAELAGRVVHEHESARQLTGQFLRWWSAKRVARVHELVTKFCG